MGAEVVRKGGGPDASSQGVALLAVLWIVAALAIAVGGIQLSVRSELRVVGAARRTVEAVAAGEAAMALALQDMLASAERINRRQLKEYRYRERLVEVQLTPLNGLIDINRAPEALLAATYTVAGKLATDAAARLAVATVEARAQRDATGRQWGFEAIQDLLRVPGVDYELYARLSPLLTAEAQGSGRVNPLAAPKEVLLVLAGGNASRAHAIDARLDSGANSMEVDITGLNGEFTGVSPSTRFRIQAKVPNGDGGWTVVLRNVDIRPDNVSGLPWRIFNAEQWIIAPP